MLRILCLLMLPNLAMAEVELRQFQSDTATPAAEILDRLTPLLPDEVTVSDTGQGAMISYTGRLTPRPLSDFVTSAFANLNPSTLQPAKPVSMTLSIMPHGDRTALILMLQGEFEARAIDTSLPVAGSTLVEGAELDKCIGQSVISYPRGLENTAQAYSSYLESAGFLVQKDPAEATSFFIGYSPGCTALLYLTPESDAETLVVLRYVED